MSDFLVGARVLERYRVVRTLGSGGMGVVYLGRTEGAEGFTRPVVIKRMQASLVGERGHNEMFVREARILSNLQHPNIVSVVDFGQQGGEYVMILEYVHGYDLDQWSQFLWRSGAKHAPDHVLYVARRVLAALHYAHHVRRPDGALANIVHRDVSLSNVLLDTQAQVKLHDFGIARMEGSSEAATETGVFKGKIGLAAPELLSGDRATPRSDLYSLGVITYQLLSGGNPFRGKDAANTMYRVMHHNPPPLSALRDDLPPGLDEVLSRAMHKDPSERYEDAAQLGHALAEFCARSDEDVIEEMAAQLVGDFARIPEKTELESLSARDAAWRDAQVGSDVTPQPLSSSPPLYGPSLPPGLALTPPSIRTGSPAAERATLPPRRVAVSASQDPASSAPFTSVRAARRVPSPALAQQRRLIMIGAAALVVLGVLSVAFVLRERAEPPTRYLVIEKPNGGAAGGAPASTALAANPESPARSPGEPLGSTPRKPPAPTRPTPSRPDANTLTQEFRRHQPRVEACIHQHVEQIDRHPQISVRFEVNASGKVTSAELTPAPLTATPLGACILGVARSVQFSPLSKPVAFSIPITARRAP